MVSCSFLGWLQNGRGMLSPFLGQEWSHDLVFLRFRFSFVLSSACQPFQAVLGHVEGPHLVSPFTRVQLNGVVLFSPFFGWCQRGTKRKTHHLRGCNVKHPQMASQRRAYELPRRRQRSWTAGLWGSPPTSAAIWSGPLCNSNAPGASRVVFFLFWGGGNWAGSPYLYPFWMLQRRKRGSPVCLWWKVGVPHVHG